MKCFKIVECHKSKSFSGKKYNLRKNEKLSSWMKNHVRCNAMLFFKMCIVYNLMQNYFSVQRTE